MSKFITQFFKDVSPKLIGQPADKILTIQTYVYETHPYDRISSADKRTLTTQYTANSKEFNLNLVHILSNEDKLLFLYNFYYQTLILKTAREGHRENIDDLDQQLKLISEKIDFLSDPHRQATGIILKEIPSFASYVNSLGQDFYDWICSIPSKLYDWIGSIHMWRIATAFAKGTYYALRDLSQHFSNFKKFIEESNDYGIKGMANRFHAFMADTRIWMNFLSFIMPGLRFIANFFGFLVHIFMPTEAEDKLSWHKRAYIEFSNRNADLVNDIIWAPINFITNFDRYVGILRFFVTNVITGAFLAFDVFWSLPRWFFAAKHFEEDYDEFLELQKMKEKTPLQKTMINLNLMQLQSQCDGANNGNLMGLIAGTLFAIGFIIPALIFTPVFVPITMFGIAAIAVAGCVLSNLCVVTMLSNSNFSIYREKASKLNAFEELSKLNNISTKDSLYNAELELYRTEKNFAAINFGTSLLIFAFPTVAIAIVTICWPASIALGGLFLISLAVNKVYKDWQDIKIASMQHEIGFTLFHRKDQESEVEEKTSSDSTVLSA